MKCLCIHFTDQEAYVGIEVEVVEVETEKVHLIMIVDGRRSVVSSTVDHFDPLSLCPLHKSKQPRAQVFEMEEVDASSQVSKQRRDLLRQFSAYVTVESAAVGNSSYGISRGPVRYPTPGVDNHLQKQDR